MSAQRPVVRQTLILLIAMLAVTLVVVVVKRTRAAASPALATPQGDDKALVRAKRAMAVTAIEKSDYQLAIKTLTEIIKDGNGVGDELQLLQIAKDLQLRFASASAPAPTPAAMPTPAPSPTPPTPTAVRAEPEPADTAVAPRGEERPKHAGGTRPRSPEKPPAPPRAAARQPATSSVAVRDEPPPSTGRLIVVSTPPGLTIKVDGEEVGFTPFHQVLAAGIHSVVLVKDGVRLGQQQAEVVSGRVVSVDLDVSERVRELERAAAPPPRTIDVTPPPPPSTEAPSRESVSASVAATGSLKVTVSNLTGGIVYVDGARRGPAPLVIDKLPAGKRVLVELSVRNFIERSTRVDIEGGKTAEVNFR